MTPDYIALRPDWNIEKALKHIRKRGRDAGTIKQKQLVSEIMDCKFIAINAMEDQENAYHLMKKYNLNVLPVVNSEGILLGIVTIDDIENGLVNTFTCC